MTESVQAKGRRYLTEGRVTVSEVSAERITATVRGQGAVYSAGFEDGEWHCDCRARSRYSHLVALQLVVAPEQVAPEQARTLQQVGW